MKPTHIYGLFPLKLSFQSGKITRRRFKKVPFGMLGPAETESDVSFSRWFCQISDLDSLPGVPEELSATICRHYDDMKSVSTLKPFSPSSVNSFQHLNQRH